MDELLVTMRSTGRSTSHGSASHTNGWLAITTDQPQYTLQHPFGKNTRLQTLGGNKRGFFGVYSPSAQKVATEGFRVAAALVAGSEQVSRDGSIPALREDDTTGSCLSRVDIQHSVRRGSQYSTLNVSEGAQQHQ